MQKEWRRTSVKRERIAIAIAHAKRGSVRIGDLKPGGIGAHGILLPHYRWGEANSEAQEEQDLPVSYNQWWFRRF
jgi:hypothetical protein